MIVNIFRSEAFYMIQILLQSKIPIRFLFKLYRYRWSAARQG